MALVYSNKRMEKHSRPRVLFIVPAYNERESLPGVIADLRQHFPDDQILVVDDGSTDDTVALAGIHLAEVVRLPFNLGIGATVQTGLLYAVRNGYDIAVQFDGDGQHRADQVEKLLAQLDFADAVIGSRFLERNSYRGSIFRRAGIFIFRLVNSILVGATITDNTSGFRAYGPRAIRFLAEEYPHDYPEPESVITLCRAGYRVKEVAVVMQRRMGGQSSIGLLKSVYYMAKVLVAVGIGVTRTRARSLQNGSANPGYLDHR
ncbi:MAG: glycosyltransferase family 2 protein [Acidobacteriota bacterium]